MRSLIYVNIQEWLRLKFFHVVSLLALAYIVLTYLLGSLSFIERQRLIFDLGLAGVELTVVFISAFIATHALSRDIERKTILMILARPIQRWKILFSYLGSLFVLNSLVILVFGLIMFFYLDDKSYTLQLAVSLLTILFKGMVIAAFGLLCAVLARAMFGLVLSLFFWVSAYAVPDLQYLAERMKNSVLISIGQVLDFAIPQFYRFNWKNYAFLTSPLEINKIIWSWSHCLIWFLFLLFLAKLFFQRKEIV